MLAMADDTIMIGARVSPEFHIQLKVAAALAQETMQDLITSALCGELRRRGIRVPFEPPNDPGPDIDAA